MAYFEVELSGKIKPSDEIKWNFNGKKIDFNNSLKYEMESTKNTCKLIIKKIKLDDDGSYGIEVNGSRTNANLTVNGKF
jgi:hypothetical protein